MLRCSGSGVVSDLKYMGLRMEGFVHVLIEMTSEPDCRFIGSWFLKVAEAQALWSEALTDPDFKNKLCAYCVPSLECAALEIFCELKQWGHVRATDLHQVELDGFVFAFGMLVQLGMFAFNGRSYQIAIPETVTRENVQNAAISLLAVAIYVGVGVEVIQPERLLYTVPKKEAEAWRWWLIQKRRFDANNLGEMRSVAGVRLSLNHAGFRTIDRLWFGDQWARWGAIVVTSRSGSGPSGGGHSAGCARARGISRA